MHSNRSNKSKSPRRSRPGTRLSDSRGLRRLPSVETAPVLETPTADAKVLIAGVGNILLGDDGFGVEVIWQLQKLSLPQWVEAIDFGIRSYDLVYALMQPRRAVILVDATLRGRPPGTVYLIRPDLDQPAHEQAQVVDAHSLDPTGVLQMARAWGAQDHHVYVIGCEPAVLETEDGRIGLSPEVQAAVPKAIDRILSLVSEVSGETLSLKRRNAPREPVAANHPV